MIDPLSLEQSTVPASLRKDLTKVLKSYEERKLTPSNEVHQSQLLPTLASSGKQRSSPRRPLFLQNWNDMFHVYVAPCYPETS